MSHSTRIRWALGGVALGILLALMLLPSTGWIARQQVADQLFLWADKNDLSELGVSSPPRLRLPGNSARREAKIRKAAEAQPDDLGVQMALALRGIEFDADAVGGSREVHALQPLLGRFGNRPELYATMIRFLGYRELNRPEAALMGDKRTSPGDFSPPAGQARKDWEAMREYAAIGERLEPDNAFFSTMAAVANLALRDDGAALAALSRAAAGRRWHDYAEKESLGAIALREAALGKQSAASEFAIVWAVMLPHYGRVNAMACVLTSLASRKEQAGQTAQGLKVRLELLRLGSLMRAEPTTLASPVVGINVGQRAIQRPGGSPNLPGAANAGTEALKRQQNALFVRYLRKYAPPRQAAWAQAEMETSAAVGQTMREMVRTDHVDGPVQKVAVLRLLNWALLLTAFWVGVLALGTWLGRGARPGDDWPAFSRCFPWTVVCALGVPLALLPLNGSESLLYARAWVALAIAALAAACLMAGAGALRAHGWEDSRRRLKALGLAIAVTAALVIWQLPSILAVPVIPAALFDIAYTGPSLACMYAYMITGSLAVVLFALLLALGLAAALRREGAAVGTVRLLGVTAMPLIAALLVCYGASVVSTARAEKHASAAVAAVLSGEGKYAAGLIGKPWPGPAPMIPPAR